MLQPGDFKRLQDIDLWFPGCVVFGGFLRDKLLGVSHRDIDIAVSIAHVGDLKEFGFVENYPDDEPYEHSLIDSSWTLGELNVISIVDSVTPQKQNQYVDIGLCAVAWSSEKDLVVDPDFVKDAENQTLTVRRRGWGEDGIRRHVDRLKQKFPDYEVIWP